MIWHRHRWPKNSVCFSVCASDDYNHKLQFVSQLMFPFSSLVTDKCFPRVSAHTWLQVTHAHTRFDPEAYMATPDIIGCFYKKKEPFFLCPQWLWFSWTVAYCALPSAMAARSERLKLHSLHRARKSSKCLHEASNDVPITALGVGANGLHLLHSCHVWVRPYATCRGEY